MGEALINRGIDTDGTVVIDLRGELDLAVERALRDMLLHEVGKPGARVVVDLWHVSFVDSTGIGALVAGYNAAQSAGTSFVVRRAAPFVAKQLKMTGVYDRLTGAAA